MVPGAAGALLLAATEGEGVAPRAKVSLMLSLAVLEAGKDPAKLGLELLPGGGTRGNVSALLPEVLSGGFGAVVPGVEGND